MFQHIACRSWLKRWFWNLMKFMWECPNKHANTFYLDIPSLFPSLSFETSDAFTSSEFSDENLNRMLFAHQMKKRSRIIFFYYSNLIKPKTTIIPHQKTRFITDNTSNSFQYTIHLKMNFKSNKPRSLHPTYA